MKFLLALLLLTSQAWSNPLADLKTVKDYALLEIAAKEIFHTQENPSEETYHFLIESLARQGKEKEMIKVYESYLENFQKDSLERDLVEKMAWGVIKSGSTQSSPLLRLIAMLAATFSQDIEGVNLLNKQLSSSNSTIRQVAVKLSCMLGDHKLKKSLITLFHKEKVWAVKIEIIRAIGALKIRELEKELYAIIEEGRVTPEERLLAIESYINLEDEISLEHIEALIGSEKSHQRLIGLKASMLSDYELELDPYLTLMRDSSSDVRSYTLYTLGQLFYETPENHQKMVQIARNSLEKDPSFEVQLSALWLLTLLKPTLEQHRWHAFLSHEKEEIRLKSSVLISTLGKRTLPIVIQTIKESSDLFVQLNLAKGLVYQRQSTDLACDILKKGLVSKRPLMMWKEHFGLKMLVPSNIPAAILEISSLDLHRVCQLELLQMLALFDAQTVQESIATFLKMRSWELNAMALTLLVTECSCDAADIIERQLKLGDFKNHRTEAIILLALWRKDEASTDLLEEEYEEASRKNKEMILEMLGKVGTVHSVPFLIECLKEPYPSLRMIAASSIIQCLNH